MNTFVLCSTGQRFIFTEVTFYKIHILVNPNLIPNSNSNSPALFQNVPKGSKSKQTQFKTSEDLVKSETNFNVVVLKRKYNLIVSEALKL